MLSNTCKYGIRAVIYIANQPRERGKIGIKQISNDLGLPTPFLGKILQQLAKQKILDSSKGPHGGFSLLKDPKKITLLDIVNTIDGDDLFTNCVIQDVKCKCTDKNREVCALHDDYENVRTELISMFSSRNIYDLINKSKDAEKLLLSF